MSERSQSNPFMKIKPNSLKVEFEGNTFLEKPIIFQEHLISNLGNNGMKRSYFTFFTAANSFIDY